MRRSLAALFVLTLVACAGGKKPPAVPPAAPSPHPVSPTAPPPPRASAPLPSPVAPPPTGAETSSVVGTVTYRERIALTPEARIQVELRDVSGGVGFEEAPVVSRQIIDRPGQVPVPFEVPYALATIAPGHAYAVSARITDRGQLQFVTDSPVPVIPNAVRDSIEIVVVPVK